MARKLAAILSADAVGYSRLMADDEAATIRTLTDSRERLTKLVRDNGGRVVDTPGDNALAEFPTALDAVRCAVAIQESLEAMNECLTDERRMRFRIGVHLGEVSIEGERVYGDAVNIAARLESLASPGDVCISGNVYDLVRSKLERDYEDIGEQTIKNIPHPVRVYRLGLATADAAPRKRLDPRRVTVVAAAVAIVIVGAGIYRGLGGFGSAGPGASFPRGASIAVLPFVNTSDDTDQEYFGDGLAENIITALSRFNGLFVIARHSTFQYKGRSDDVRAVGKELGVRYVLEGSVRKTADRIRVAVRLVDAADGKHLWAETYDRDLTAQDVFEVQDGITAHVVAAIGGQSGVLSRTAMQVLRAKRTDKLDAYDCLLRSYAYLVVHTAGEHRQARDCLERAVESDPGYVDAQAWLAYTYAEESRHGWNKRPELYDSLDRALEVAHKAVELDPGNQVAHGVLAIAHFDRHDLDRFYPEAEKAHAINPNNAFWLAIIGSYMVETGDWERGMPMVKRAVALNPHYPDWLHIPFFLDHYRNGRYTDALTQVQKINLEEFYRVHLLRAAALGQLGRTEEAGDALSRMLELKPDPSKTVRDEFNRYNYSDEILEHLMQGLRKAGLNE